MNHLFYVKNKYYDFSILKPRTIKIKKFPESILKYSVTGQYYDLFPENWRYCFSTRHIRSNLRNNVIPCVNLEHLYTLSLTDPSMYMQGKLLGQLLKNNMVVFYFQDKEFIPQIPKHLILKHLSEWAGIKVEVIKDRIALSVLKVISKLGVDKEEEGLFSRIDLKLLS